MTQLNQTITKTSNTTESPNDQFLIQLNQPFTQNPINQHLIKIQPIKWNNQITVMRLQGLFIIEKQWKTLNIQKPNPRR